MSDWRIPAPATSAVIMDISGGNQTVPATRWVYVGGAGDLACVLMDGTAVTFTALAAGTLLPISVIQFTQTGTDASLVLGLI